MIERKLGRRQPKNAPALRLGHLLTGTVPAHPAAADHFGEVRTWVLGANDKFGTCGPTSASNLTVLVKRYLAGMDVTVTDDAVFDLYRHAGNPNFDPATDADDNGVDLQTMLEAWVKYGLVVIYADGTTAVVKPVAFAKVDEKNLDEVRAAIAIFGACIFGVDLEVAQQSEPSLWDYHRTPDWGGHAIMAGLYTSATSGADVSVISWKQIFGLTDRFAQHQLGEVWAVIFEEHLTDPGFMANVNVTQLAEDFHELTGATFPVPVQPTPAPEPPAPAPGPAPIGDPDAALVTALNPWAAEHHTGVNAAAARAFVAWREARGL